MKINKKILLASMLVTNLVSAQEYYTCVPKKNWWLKIVKEGTKKFGIIKFFTNTSLSEKYFKESLEPGRYKITLSTGEGVLITKEYILDERYDFDACIGVLSKDGRKTNTCISAPNSMYFKFSKKAKKVDENRYMSADSTRYIMIERLK